MKLFTSEEDAHLRVTLKRCSTTTYIAAREFRKTGNPEHLLPIVHGILERYIAPKLRPKLMEPDDGLRLVEDLNLDSLTLTEIVILVEDVLQISIYCDEPRHFRTLGDLKQAIRTHRAGQSPRVHEGSDV